MKFIKKYWLPFSLLAVFVIVGAVYLWRRLHPYAGMYYDNAPITTSVWYVVLGIWFGVIWVGVLTMALGDLFKVWRETALNTRKADSLTVDKYAMLELVATVSRVVGVAVIGIGLYGLGSSFLLYLRSWFG